MADYLNQFRNFSDSDSDNRQPNKPKVKVPFKNKLFIGGIAFFLLAIIIFSIFTVRVPNGYIGVVYSMNGGVKDEILEQGTKVKMPWEKVTFYTVAREQLNLTNETTVDKDGDIEGEDNSFKVTCKDGTMVVGLEMQYNFERENIIDVFKTYRGLSGTDVVNEIAKNKIKAKVSEVTSKYTIIEAYLDKREQLNYDIEIKLKKELKDMGIHVEKASIVDAKPSAEVTQAIEQRAKADQELEIEKKKQQKAIIEAETKVIQAKGDADALLVQKEAEAKANELIKKTMTKELVQYEYIKKWDGVEPKVKGDTSAIVDMRGE